MSSGDEQHKIPTEIQSGIEGFDASKLKPTETVESGTGLPSPDGCYAIMIIHIISISLYIELYLVI